MINTAVSQKNDFKLQDNPMILDIENIAKSRLSPIANCIDQEGYYPIDIMADLGKAGAFAQHLDFNDNRFDLALANMRAISRECGSTGFMSWCHDVCGLYMEKSGNNSLIDRVHDHAYGKTFGGTGLSNPMKAFTNIEKMALKAKKVSDGYIVSGTLPWVSHIAKSQYCGAIAAVENKIDETSHEVFFILDIDDQVSLTKCPQFSGMEGTSTWGIKLNDYFVSDAQIIADPARPFIKKIRSAFILLQTGWARGVIQASIDACREVESSLGHVNQFLHNRPDELEAELEDLEKRIDILARNPFDSDKEHMLNVLDTRAHCGELSLKASQSALLHQGARGYLMKSKPQRLIREAHFVAIVTPAIKHLRWEMAKLMSN
ncbi:MAG: acyl-CoA dehydrogenase [Actinobacteria bacterium TMED172]|nr:acyl-CoA dehydrogenase [Cellvibrionales bacterium]OUW32115.1 MAG: acyl-CoA dehydrogenase [Actinobacteria bacterium TMED172]|tara:strand:+ start:73089 stop:74213 length:1125 start_codon:yes stop_codon:yes gene_type:complete